MIVQPTTAFLPYAGLSPSLVKCELLFRAQRQLRVTPYFTSLIDTIHCNFFGRNSVAFG